MDSGVLVVPQRVISESLAFLRSAGDEKKERVVLWLAKPENGRNRVKEVFVPDQEAEEDFFWIPHAGMRRILAHLRNTGFYVGAQVHSHPKEAFHSPADDRWALVRHVDALSIVVPYFARHVTVERFVKQTALFSLSATNRWIPIPATQMHSHYRIE